MTDQVLGTLDTKRKEIGAHIIMTRRPKSRDPFHHPEPDEVDFGRLLATMKDCHAEVRRFWQHCGLRNPAQIEARALLAQLCALAALTRVPGAEAQVNPPTESHSAGGTPRPPVGGLPRGGGNA